MRAGIFDQTGRLIKSSAQELKIWNPRGTRWHFYEQSSDNIWESCCKVVKVNLNNSFVCSFLTFFYVKDVVENIDIDAIAGIGFDATCSLVALDNNDSPITVSPTGN